MADTLEAEVLRRMKGHPWPAWLIALQEIRVEAEQALARRKFQAIDDADADRARIAFGLSD